MTKVSIMKEAQEKYILKYLQRGNSITSIEAMRLCGCFRLAARIYDLIQAGYDIVRKMVKIGGKFVARYSLKGAK